MNDMSIRTIDECFYQIRNGANIKQGTVEGGYPITRIETTANDRFNRDRMGYAGITDIEKYESYILQDGDLLMSHINSVQYLGRTVLYEKQGIEKIIHGMNLLGLKARRDIIIPAYARYCFYSYSFRQQIGRITKKSVNQASFAVADLKKIKIKVPDLSEQSRVVDILNRLNQVIEDRQQELQKLDDLTKARFVEMFGDLMINDKEWQQAKISDICVEIVDCINKTAPTVEYETEYKMLRTTNVKNGDVNITEVKYVKREEFEKWTRRSVPRNGDVLLTREAPMGQVGILQGVKNDVFLGQRLVSYRCNFVKMNSVFLTYQMMSKYFQNQIEKTGKGSTVKHIPVPVCTEFEVFVPPIELQKQFADFVNQVDKSKVEVQKALDETQKLFDSLMQQYFG